MFTPSSALPSDFDADSFKESVLNSMVRDHSRVYGTAFDPEGRFLAACTNSGQVHFWDVAKHLTPSGILSATEKPPKPDVSFQAHAGPSYSLCFVPTSASPGFILVTGGDTEVRCWRVNLDGVDPVATQVAEFRNPAPFHTKGVMQLSETNGVAWDSMSGLLFTAAGDGNAYAWDVHTVSPVPKATFSGHTDYLHAVTTLPSLHAIATGSEDGTAKLWDIRNHKSAVATFSPYSLVTSGKGHSSSGSSGGVGVSSSSGKSVSDGGVDSDVKGSGVWVGSVAVAPGDNWLSVGCGGLSHGTSSNSDSGLIAVYHVGSRLSSVHMHTPGPVMSLVFQEGELLSGGGVGGSGSCTEAACVQCWSMKTGTCTRTIPTLIPSTIFSLTANTTSGRECLVAGGCSPLLDVCASFGNRTFSLSC